MPVPMVCSRVTPLQLQFQLLLIARNFVFNRQMSICRHCEPVTGDLNAEALACFDGIGNPAKLCGKLGGYDIPFYVSLGHNNVQ